jgi:RimJ/RimL family protein N-acetyltransferase
MPFTFRRPIPADAEMLLDWRTRPEITRFMLTDIENDIEQQRRWLSACETRRDYEHFVMLRQGRPVGYLSYGQIDRVSRHCVPGTYLVLPPAERHLAAHSNSFILDYCFYRMGMNKAVFTIMAGNDHFIRAKHLTGVRQIGILKDHVWKYGRFHDLHMFEQTRAEWEATKRLFSIETTLGAFPAETGAAT